MNTVALKASARAKDANVKTLRKGGQVPAIVYGNADNAMLQIEEVSLKKAYAKAGESTLVELEIDGKMLPVLFHSIDCDPVSDRMIHVDFYAVNMKKEVEADVHIRFENESPAVKEGAILVVALHEVEVKALPSNLPHDLAVDLGKLVEMGSTLTVADIIVPEGVTIITDASSVIAIAQEPRAEEVVEVAAAPAEGVAAEGAATAPGAAGTPAAGAAAPAADAGKKKE